MTEGRSATSEPHLPFDGVKFIEAICTDCGPRIAGGDAERQATDYIAQELRTCCEDVQIDAFPVRPTFYPGGFLRILQFLVYGAVGCHFLGGWGPWLSPLLLLLGGVILLVSLGGMKLWVAGGFRKAVSHNVFGHVSPRTATGEHLQAQRTVIIAGHTDSAFAMPLTRFGDRMLGWALGVGIFLGWLLLSSLAKGVGLLTARLPVLGHWIVFQITGLDLVVAGVSVIGLPVVTLVFAGLRGKTPVLGANDNLSGVAVALAVAHHFAQPKHHLRHVDLWVGAFGSEECGERGSHAFIRKYGPLGRLQQAEAVIPESVGAGTHLAVVTAEPMHFVRHHLPTCRRLQRAYDTVQVGLPPPVIPCALRRLKMAASDAGRFALAGYPSAMLLAYEGQLLKPPNWHALTDDPAHLDPHMLATATAIFIEYCRQLDADLASRSDSDP